MKKHFQYWGATYIIGFLWLLSSILHWWMQVRIGGDTWYLFGASTFENLQSEFLQLVVQAVLLLGLGHYLFKADKKDMEELQADVKEIKELLSNENKSKTKKT